jgi:hypothetical protein
MSTELTVSAMLLAGLGVLSTVVGKLWNKLEKYQLKIEAELVEANKKLIDCEKEKFSMIRDSIKQDLQMKKEGG